MNRCKTCKWWEDFKLSEGRRAGACNQPKLSVWIVDPDGLSVTDESVKGYRPNTGPEFGCVHHEFECRGPCTCPPECCYWEDMHGGTVCRRSGLPVPSKCP